MPPFDRREQIHAIWRTGFPPTANPGLVLDKYLYDLEPSSQGQLNQALVKKVSALSDLAQNVEYQGFYARWRKRLTTQLEPSYAAMGKVLKTAFATVEGRMVVGMGNASVIETAITLHRTYGVPYIPGRALKGLASRFAHNHLEEPEPGYWHRGSEEHEHPRGEGQTAIFGSGDESAAQAQSGGVTFFDALPVPDRPPAHGNRLLVPDVLTPHHQDYYGGEDAPPADWDNPVPIPFLTATGTYLIVLAGEKYETKVAFDILKLAMEAVKKDEVEEGVGGKTNVGYGRFKWTESAI